MEIKIVIPNLEAIRQSLLRSPEIVVRHTNIAINRSIMDIRNTALDTTPKRRGHLSGTIEMKFSNLRGEIFPTANYKYWVHEGSGIYVGHKRWLGKIPGVGWRWIKGQKPNPYLKNAVNRSQEKIKKNFEQGLSDALTEIGKQ